MLVPSGPVFREQNIILALAGEESMPRFHAPKLFMGAANIGRQGVMQADVMLVAAERCLIDRADEVILCVDSSKFGFSSGNVVCGLHEIDIVITDPGISEANTAMIRAAGVELVIADRAEAILCRERLPVWMKSSFIHVSPCLQVRSMNGFIRRSTEGVEHAAGGMEIDANAKYVLTNILPCFTRRLGTARRVSRHFLEKRGPRFTSTAFAAPDLY
ncbi:hypothetical protein V6U71_18620 [Sphingopyxis sp. J-6]|uniref:hypothetical protein n=1 Tax=Sphingopyxis sp. J-6 TaxID=3122054 RepID=UPI0039840D11